MSNDRQVISYVSPAELVALMQQTGVIAVHESGVVDGKPVIHAAVKVVNAETGEQLPGGLPFSVVMFKGPNEPGYSNIAIGTIVPTAELRVTLPADYFNFCNQRFRFTRAFPIDARSFVIQMDLMLRNATREYVKFGFGLWSALFSQMLFELMGRRRESLISAAAAYAAAHTDFAEQIAPAIAPQAEMPMPLDVAAIVPEEPALEMPVDVPPADEVPSVKAETVAEPASETASKTDVADAAAVEGPAPETPTEVSSTEDIAATAEAVAAEMPAVEPVAVAAEAPVVEAVANLEPAEAVPAREAAPVEVALISEPAPTAVVEADAAEKEPA